MKAAGILIAFVIIAGIFGASGAFSKSDKAGVAPTHDQIAGTAYLKKDASELKDTIITSHLEQAIVPGKNLLWCSTFQLAWNELYDLSGGPVKLKPASHVADILNRRGASKADIDAASYVAKAGFIEDGAIGKIRKELKSKFHGQDFADLFQNVPRSGIIAYGYLLKSLPFEWAFDRFSNRLTFQGMAVEDFGISEYLPDDQPSEAKMAGQISVVDYAGSDDLIVELKTIQKDEHLILAKVTPQRTLQETVRMVQRRMADARPAEMQKATSMLVPVLDFDLLKSYMDLTGRSVQSSNDRLNDQPIVAAMQSIRFRLDETGAVLESGGMMLLGGAPPGNLIFDKPFLVMLQRKDAKTPYFALWVGNTELLLPAGARRPYPGQ